MKTACEVERLPRHSINDLGIFAFQHISVRGVSLDQRTLQRERALNRKGKRVAYVEHTIVQPINISSGTGIVLVPTVIGFSVLVPRRQCERTPQDKLVAGVGNAIADQRNIHRPQQRLRTVDQAPQQPGYFVVFIKAHIQVDVRNRVPLPIHGLYDRVSFEIPFQAWHLGHHMVRLVTHARAQQKRSCMLSAPQILPIQTKIDDVVFQRRYPCQVRIGSGKLAVLVTAFPLRRRSEKPNPRLRGV